MFPNDLWIVYPGKAPTGNIGSDGRPDKGTPAAIYRVVDDIARQITIDGDVSGYGARSVLIHQDQVSVFIASVTENTVTHYLIGSDGALHQKKIIKAEEGINAPYGMCQDPSGNVYVANYGNDTVTKISVPAFGTLSADDTSNVGSVKVVRNFKVDGGPRSVCSNSSGSVFVACSTGWALDANGAPVGGLVDVIQNDAVTRMGGSSSDYDKGTGAIRVANNPYFVTCDNMDNIWVACFGSNVVTKISSKAMENYAKYLDIPVGRGPVAVVCDRECNAYVANYLGNSVTFINNKKIEQGISDTSVITTPIPVGDGPNAIDVVSDNTVYVVNSLSNSITKIKDQKILSDNPNTIIVCDSPSAIGDFTGCAAYNCFNTIKTGDDLTRLENKISENAQRIDTLRGQLTDYMDRTNTRLATDEDAITKNTANIALVKEEADKTKADLENFMHKVFNATIIVNSIENAKDHTGDPDLANQVITFEVSGVKQSSIEKVTLQSATDDNVTFEAKKSVLDQTYSVTIPTTYISQATMFIFKVKITGYDETFNIEQKLASSLVDKYTIFTGWLGITKEELTNNSKGIKDIPQSTWDGLNTDLYNQYARLEVSKKGGTFKTILSMNPGHKCLYIAIPKEIANYNDVNNLVTHVYLNNQVTNADDWTISTTATLDNRQLFGSNYAVFFTFFDAAIPMLITYENYTAN